MCGISGWFLKPGVSRPMEELRAMAEMIKHRGPDDQGFFVDESCGVAFGHNRLSIIDLTEGGHQPMVSEDGKIVLVYNGEIYNFRELRKELEGLGHRFRSQCDTEVVLRSFRQWGEDCVNRFCGMFAFAVWSTRDRKLFLARDPMGMKPLYYGDLPDRKGFVFASEVKAFLALPDFKPEINRSSLQQFLEFGYTYDENETIFEGVFKLPPGHTLEVKDGEAGRLNAFFNPPGPSHTHTNILNKLSLRGAKRRSNLDFENEIASLPLVARNDTNIINLQEKLYSVLTEVVSQHLVADVPVGLLLSGGIDSSVIAAIASKQKRITTVSMSFAKSQVDETPYARLVSQYIGSDHHEVVIYPQELIQDLDKVTWHFDDLFADWGLVSTRLLYKKCREIGIKVVIVGEGSDEIFGGYSNFAVLGSDQNHAPLLWKLFQLYRYYAGRRYGSQFSKFYSIMRPYLKESHGDMFHAIRLFESRNQLPNNYVMKVDKASMAVSVEARAPYLDRRVAELVYQAPRDFLLKSNLAHHPVEANLTCYPEGGRLWRPAEGSQVKVSNKFLLRSMAERYELLPKEIIWREKYGASMAISWMDESEEFRQYAREVILNKDGWVDRLDLRKAMTDYFDKGREGYAFPHPIGIFRNLAWRLLLLNLWSRVYLVDSRLKACGGDRGQHA